MTEEISSNPTPDVVTTSALVAAYVSNNSVPGADLPRLITTVHAALADLRGGRSSSAFAASAAVGRPSAIEIRRSVQPDGIVSFIDGRTYKTLKRHLTAHGLHPQSYRERYGLPDDYPMVAAAYAERRSAIAKSISLGQPGGMAAREQSRERRSRAA